MIPSYSSPLNFGHKDTRDFFDGDYIIEEKIDGSQISFRLYDSILKMRSHGQQINENNLGMFAKAWETACKLNLTPGWTYRGEFLQKPKHNILTCARVPVGNIILYDIDTGDQNYLPYHEMSLEAERIGLECVPLIATRDSIPMQQDWEDWLQHESILGGTKIEGVVLKNYRHLDRDQKIMMIKYVSPQFREKHTGQVPTQNIIQDILAEYGGEARWNKVIQHLTENGVLEGSLKDIGPLMKELNEDFERECKEEIKDKLYGYYRKQILRGISDGFPEWYKEKLAQDFME